MKYTQEELNDFIREIKNLCMSKIDCEECPLHSDSICAVYKCPNEWTELKTKKKLKQLNFDIKEDREMLRGKTLIHDNPLRPGDKEECEVKGFFYDARDEHWRVVISDLWGTCAAYCEQSLFCGFVFADTGLRVGKEVIE